METINQLTEPDSYEIEVLKKDKDIRAIIEVKKLKESLIKDILFFQERIDIAKKTNNVDWIIPAQSKIEFIMEKFDIIKGDIENV